jgi:hypothetical protein
MGSAGESLLTRTTVTNLKICITQLLVTEALVILPVGLGKHSAVSNYERILSPIYLLTLAPTRALLYGWYSGSIGFLVIVSIDVVFLSIIIFSVLRNHKIVGGVCLFVFNFLCFLVDAMQFF